MSELDIIRAWKDKTYRNSLSADELAQLPEHPAGAIELTNDELAYVDGAANYYASPASAASVASAIASLANPICVLTIALTSAVATLVSAAVSYNYGTNGTYCCRRTY